MLVFLEMRFLKAIVLFLCVCCSSILFAQQSTYVIVHGAWGGAWQFKKTAHRLVQEGHVVYRPTMTGLGERFHLMQDDINLDTHIKDVVNTILFENLTDVVLVGHSYGGMVITGVVDSIPERIKRVVYLDAIVPENEKSAIESLGMDSSNVSSRFKVKESTIIPTWVRDTTKTPRDVPHPIRTFTEKIRLNNQKRLTIPTTYIFTFEKTKGGEEKDDFYPFYKKAVQNNWKVRKLEASHNPQIDKLDELVQILLEEK